MWVLHLFHAPILLLTHVIAVTTQKHSAKHTVSVAVSELFFCVFGRNGSPATRRLVIIIAHRGEMMSNLLLCHVILFSLRHFSYHRRLLVQEIVEPLIIL